MKAIDGKQAFQASKTVYDYAVRASAVVFAILMTFLLAAPINKWSGGFMESYAAVNYGAWLGVVVKVLWGILSAIGIFFLSQAMWTAILMGGIWVWFLRLSKSL